jgi:ubiquinone/menaquinone biosynthesis C-methylase UbiE
MCNNIFKCIERPSLYKENNVNFWNDEHISKHMLEAHLNPEFEGASRKLSFIEESVKWIQEAVPSGRYTKLLDVGCGPGLYAKRFSKAGYEVTGIDFSKRSIDYAKTTAKKQDLDIQYVYQNYLEMDYSDAFDFATFIYCDYGALSIQNRAAILRKIYHSLKSGGKLLLDVFSMVKYNQFEELKTWEVQENGGFWSPAKYLSLNAQYKYLDNVTLKHTTVITEKEMREYCIWDCYFTAKTLEKEVLDAGFKKAEIFSDVTGAPYLEDSPTIAILLEK